MAAITGHVREWAGRLAAAGVPSPEHDARYLAAHVLRLPIAQLILVDGMTPAQVAAVDALVVRRAAREPLQHIVGTAPFMDLELRVGPGVFVPRPETESLADHAIRWLRHAPNPVVVELFAGTGAVAFAVACHVPGARVVAVELSSAALAYAPSNRADLADRMAALGSDVEFRQGDATSVLAVADLCGCADAVLANPPYIPQDCLPRDPEVRDHDPSEALYAGPDGMSAIRPLLDVAAVALRPGGLLAVEHGDQQGGADGVPGLVSAHGGPAGRSFTAVVDHLDLARRPRFTTGILGAGDAGH